ncbi:Chitin synthase, class 2 [Ancistrocladus abbreviatus]
MAQKAKSPATVLAIGTAVPPNCISQADFPDYYFSLTNSEHITELKEKFKRICNKDALLVVLFSALQKMLSRTTKVLVVCSEITTIFFRGPFEHHMDSLVGQTLFGDGAATLIIGSGMDETIEKPLYQLILASQTLVLDSENAMALHLREEGLTVHLSNDVPTLISNKIDNILVDAFTPLNINDWNSLFYITHLGGRAILDGVEKRLGLNKDKMKESQYVLGEYGNLTGACVLLILDNMRKRSIEEGRSATGKGCDYGVLLRFGLGIAVETVVLRSCPLNS